MPNIKSAKKRVLVTETKNRENKSIKSKIATYIKKFKAELEANNVEKATALYGEVCSLLDKAAHDNIVHANYATRRKAHFAKLLSDKTKA